MSKINGFVKALEPYYAKAPKLPAGGREFLVSVAPWAALVFGVLTIFASLSAFGIGAVSAPLLAMGGAAPIELLAAAVLGLIEGVLMLLAFPPLRKRLMRGWMLLVWVEVVSVVGSLFTLSIGSIVWSILVAALVFYFLFQVKSYYK